MARTTGFLLTLCLLLAVRAGADEQRTRRDIADALRVATTAAENNQPEHAYDILSRLIREDPANIEVNFAYGMTCFQLERYPFARMAYERILQADPNHVPARYALARTYMVSGETELAREEFERVLALNPPAHVRSGARKFLDQLGAPPSAWRMNGRLEAGWLTDNNVNVGPSAEQIDISPIRFGSQIFDTWVPDETTKPAEDDGFLATAAISALRGIGDTGEWEIGPSFLYNERFLKDHEQNDTRYAQAGLQARHRDQARMLTLPVSAARIDYGDDPLMDIYEFAPAVTRQGANSRDTWWSTALTLQQRDYDSMDDRDSQYVALSRSLRKTFGAGKNHVFSGDGALFQEFADSDVFSNYGGTIGAGLQLQAGPELSLLGSGSYTHKRYDGKEILAKEDRVDNLVILSAGASRPLRGNWRLDVTAAYMDNYSTFALYDYDRTILSASTSVSF